MTHTVVHQEKLIARVRRIKGQIEGIERALEQRASCAEVLRQLASARGALGGLTSQVMQEHLEHHVLGAADETQRQRAAQELAEVINTYLK